MEEKKSKRFIFLLIGIVFFVFTAICTMYSISIYPDSLVKVEVVSAQNVQAFGNSQAFEVPKTAIIPDPNDPNLVKFLVVEQRESAWGYKYFLQEKIAVYNAENMLNDDLYIKVSPLGDENEEPIVESYLPEYFPGLEVTLSFAN